VSQTLDPTKSIDGAENRASGSLTNTFASASATNFFSTDNNDLVDHARAGLSSGFSSIYVGNLDETSLITSEEDDNKDLKHLKLHLLQSNIRQLEQDIVTLTERMERNDHFIDRLDTIEKRLENLDPKATADKINIAELQKFSNDLDKEELRDDIEIKDVKDRIDKVLKSNNATNEDVIQACKDGKCTLRDARTSIKNTIKAKRIKIADYQQEIEQSGSNITIDTENESPESEITETDQNRIESPSMEYDHALDDRAKELKALVNDNNSIAAYDLEDFKNKFPDQAKAIDNLIAEYDIKVTIEHVPNGQKNETSMAFNTAAPGLGNTLSTPKPEINLDPKYDLSTSMSA